MLPFQANFLSVIFRFRESYNLTYQPPTVYGHESYEVEFLNKKTKRRNATSYKYAIEWCDMHLQPMATLQKLLVIQKNCKSISNIPSRVAGRLINFKQNPVLKDRNQ